MENCNKAAVGGGLCSGHGGGRKCKHDGCEKTIVKKGFSRIPVYEIDQKNVRLFSLILSQHDFRKVVPQFGTHVQMNM